MFQLYLYQYRDLYNQLQLADISKITINLRVY